ncbi:MAG: HisA/HisF-related TIM barrel protein, partial [Thermoproteota archaeon]
MKVIPAIDLMEGQVVRLVQGKPQNKTVYSDKPQEIAKRWEKDGADMLHIVDLDATLQRGSNFDLIRRIAQEVS